MLQEHVPFKHDLQVGRGEKLVVVVGRHFKVPTRRKTSTNGVFTPEQDNDKTNDAPVHSYDAFHTGPATTFL